MTTLANRTASPAPLATRSARAAVTVLFFVNGMILGGYAASLPALRQRLGLDTTDIAAMLLVGGLAGIVSMQIGGRLADGIGARPVAVTALPVLILGAITLGLAPAYPVAVTAVVFIGLGNGSLDVSMNAIAVQVESARGRPILSFFHALWSLGNFAGAGVVLLLATGAGITGGDIVMPLMLSLATVALAALVVLLRITPTTARIEHTVDGVKIKIPRVAWLLGVMALAFGLSEGTAADWSSLQVTDVARVSPATGSLGLVAVSGFMVLIRLVGDRLVTRFGRRVVVRFGGLVAALGYLTVTLVGGLGWLVAGWALVGFGVGMIAPQVYAVAGHLGGGRVLAVVVTFGYAAFLIGPAVIGFGVNHLGIQHAMAVPAVLCAAILALATTMPDDESLAIRA